MLFSSAYHISDRTVLRILSVMLPRVDAHRVFRVEGFRLTRGVRRTFRSANLEVAAGRRVVLEFEPVIAGLEGKSVGLDERGAVCIGEYTAFSELAWLATDYTLTPAQSDALASTIEVVRQVIIAEGVSRVLAFPTGASLADSASAEA